MRLIIVLLFRVSIFTSKAAISQEVPVPETLRTLSNSKCYWSYSVERKSTKKDGSHKYFIRASLIEKDSLGNYNWALPINNASIYCSFYEKNIPKKVHFKKVNSQWIARFKITTNQPLQLKIIANYNQHVTTMPLILNQGTFPGEPDS